MMNIERRWKNAEIKVLAECYDVCTMEELAAILQRSKNAVLTMASRVGISNRKYQWRTSSELALATRKSIRLKLEKSVLELCFVRWKKDLAIVFKEIGMIIDEFDDLSLLDMYMQGYSAYGAMLTLVGVGHAKKT